MKSSTKRNKLARLVEQQNGCCCYCGMGGVKLTLEHKIPRSCGGTNDDKNLAAACFECNSLADAAFNSYPKWMRELIVRKTEPGNFMRIDIFNPSHANKKQHERAVRLRSVLEKRLDEALAF